MSAREALEKVINVIIAMGFMTVAVGVGLWFLEVARRLDLSLEITLVFGGGIVLAFGLLAAKLASRMQS